MSGGFTSLGHNLIGNSSGGSGFADGLNGDQVGTSADPIDPKLGRWPVTAAQPRPTPFRRGSPAIDHGDNTNLRPADQRARRLAQKDGNFGGLAIVDIGAFER